MPTPKNTPARSEQDQAEITEVFSLFPPLPPVVIILGGASAGTVLAARQSAPAKSSNGLQELPWGM
jgi:hypothetical protein